MSNPAAGDEIDLGGEAVGVLTILSPLSVLELAREVDQPAPLSVLLQYVDQPVLKGDDAAPRGAVDPLAGLFVD